MFDRFTPRARQVIVLAQDEARELTYDYIGREHLLLGAFRRGARGEIERNLALCHEAFPVLEERSSQLAGSMSGGQQQMLAIARAIMSAPRLLLVDEPSVGLSPVLVKQMIDTIAALKRQFGLTVLMAEQNFTQAIRIADRGAVAVGMTETTPAAATRDGRPRSSTWPGPGIGSATSRTSWTARARRSRNSAIDWRCIHPTAAFWTRLPATLSPKPAMWPS